MISLQSLGRLVHPVLLLLAVLGLPHAAGAQQSASYAVQPDYTVRHWTIRDGLPSNSITSVLKAQDGYVWIGTTDGIVRFDGARFSVFTTANTPALANNRITSLVEANDGSIWAGISQGEVVRFSGGGFERMGIAGADLGRQTLLSADADTVWVSSDIGLVRYVGRSGTVVARDPMILPTLSLARDQAGRLWLGTREHGVLQIGPGQARTWWTTQDGLPSGAILNLIAEPDGSMWVEAERGTVRIHNDEIVQQVPSSRRAKVRSGSMEHAPVHWWVDEEIDETGTHTYRLFDKEGRAALRINSAIPTGFEEETGTLWVGSYNRGLFMLNRSHLMTLGVEKGLGSENVYPILQAQDGTIWVGTFAGGITRFDEALRPTRIGDPGDAIRERHILSLYEDRQGTIWAGSYGGTCRIEGTRCEQVDMPVHVVSAMAEDREGRFWVGHGNGLVVGQPSDDGWTWSSVRLKKGQEPREVRTILETDNGTVLFGSAGTGVLRAGGSGGLEALDETHGLASNNVRDLYQDQDGYVWIALEDQGLCRLRSGTEWLRGGVLEPDALRCIGTEEGLYYGGLHRLIEDDYGRFWFNTNRGVFWVTRSALMDVFDGRASTVASISYTEAHGMRNREGNGGMQPAGIKAQDGRLWFPTQDGVVIIDPTKVALSAPPAVRIETVRYGDVSAASPGSVYLGANARDVEFRYTALEFLRPEDVRFQVQLEGYDEDWRDVGDDTGARYTSLAPGRYTFRVRAGIGGEWGEPQSVRVRQAGFVWEYPWFWALVVLGVLGLLYGGYRYRLRRAEARSRELEGIVVERTAQLQAQAEELERANDMKSRFLANISHELRTPLTLTFAPIDELLKGRYGSVVEAQPHFEAAKRNGQRLLRLIEQLLAMARLDAGALQLHPVETDLVVFVKQRVAAFESLATAQGITLAFQPRMATMPFVFDAEKIETVLLNLLSNAVKFTPSGGRVEVVLEESERNEAVLTVRDTGPGIEAAHLANVFGRFYQVDTSPTRAHEGAGIGLALVRQLVELHGGTVSVESTPGEGALFTVRLPSGLEAEASAVHVAGDGQPEEVQPAVLVRSSEVPRTEDAEGLHPDGEDDRPVVLVVEDNLDLRTLIHSYLPEFRVLEAANGKEGLRLAISEVPDLVLSDVMMPEMDGFALTRTLRAETSTSHIPVVLLTARADAESQVEGMEEGADGYLTKPFDSNVLRATIAGLIRQRRALYAVLGQPALHKEAGTEAKEEGIARLAPREVAWLDEVRAVIEAHFADTAFGVEALAEGVAMSPRQLRRKLRALTDETPQRMLRRLRIERAEALLQDGLMLIKEVADAVGYADAESFRRAFRAERGVSPSEVATHE